MRSKKEHTLLRAQRGLRICDIGFDDKNLLVGIETVGGYTERRVSPLHAITVADVVPPSAIVLQPNPGAQMQLLG